MSDNLKLFFFVAVCFLWGICAIASSSAAFTDGGFFLVLAGICNLCGAGYGIYLHLTKKKDKK